MKEEIGHLPKSTKSNEKCQYCRTTLLWSVLYKKDKEIFYSCDGDYSKYSKVPREYICDVCTRNNRIDTILN